MHKKNCFITLTYGDDCPLGLEYSDFQKFMRRLRKQIGPARFFACGEYGSENYRPHFHACLFGVDFDRSRQVGQDLYSSKILDKLWSEDKKNIGLASFGNISYQSAAYVAGYCIKKIDGEKADEHYSRCDPYTGEFKLVAPEMGRMSLRPAIGYEWFRRYWKECSQARDGIVLRGGFSVAVPRYYDKLLDRMSEDDVDIVKLITDKEFDRFQRGLLTDNSPRARMDAEINVRARLNLKRNKL